MSSVPPHERSKEARVELLDHYLETLTTDLDGKMPFNREDFLECFEHTYQFVVRLFMPMMPSLFKMIGDKAQMPPGLTKEMLSGLIVQSMKAVFVEAVEHVEMQEGDD